jgi:hypothetical protein
VLFEYDPSNDNDAGVDTRFYKDHIKDYSAKKISQKEKYDLKNAHIKKILKNSRLVFEKEEYLIIEYTKIFDQTKYCQYFNQTMKYTNIFINECPYKNCRFTCDKNEFINADALLFHVSDTDKEAAKDKNYISNIKNMHEKYPAKLFM